MTTPRDAIGLSDRLLAEIGQPVIYRNDAVLREAATALDALQARVKELEVSNRTAKKWQQWAEDERAKYESRATSAEQERDEAYERLKPFANGSIDVSGTAVIVGYPDAEHALKAARDCVRQLEIASGPDKEPNP